MSLFIICLGGLTIGYEIYQIEKEIKDYREDVKEIIRKYRPIDTTVFDRWKK